MAAPAKRPADKVASNSRSMLVYFTAVPHRHTLGARPSWSHYKKRAGRPRSQERAHAIENRSSGRLPESPLDLFYHSFHQRSVLGELFRGLRLEAQDQYRLGIRGAHQTPALGELHTHPVHIDDLILTTEVVAHFLRDMEFEFIRTVHTDFRRGAGRRQIGE